MTTRRSFFAMLAGFGAAIAARPLRAQAVQVEVKWVVSKDPTPRPQHYAARGTIMGIDYAVGGTSITLISNGVYFIPIESDEGQAILNESAVNLRADGSIRHRQHHPTDFPPR